MIQWPFKPGVFFDSNLLRRLHDLNLNSCQLHWLSIYEESIRLYPPLQEIQNLSMEPPQITDTDDADATV